MEKSTAGYLGAMFPDIKSNLDAITQIQIPVGTSGQWSGIDIADGNSYNGVYQTFVEKKYERKYQPGCDYCKTTSEYIQNQANTKYSNVMLGEIKYTCKNCGRNFNIKIGKLLGKATLYQKPSTSTEQTPNIVAPTA